MLWNSDDRITSYFRTTHLEAQILDVMSYLRCVFTSSNNRRHTLWFDEIAFDPLRIPVDRSRELKYVSEFRNGLVTIKLLPLTIPYLIDSHVMQSRFGIQRGRTVDWQEAGRASCAKKVKHTFILADITSEQRQESYDSAHICPMPVLDTHNTAHQNAGLNQFTSSSIPNYEEVAAAGFNHRT